MDDLFSVDSKGLSERACEVLARINMQWFGIAGGVHLGKYISSMREFSIEPLLTRVFKQLNWPEHFSDKG